VEEIRTFIDESSSQFESSSKASRLGSALPGRWMEVIEHGGEYPPE